MNKKEFIDEIYKKSINTILDGISLNYKNEVCVGYYTHLQTVYANFDLTNKDAQKLIDVFANMEISKFKESRPDIVLSEFVKDEALENIKNISSSGFEYAKIMLKNKYQDGSEVLTVPIIDEQTANENIKLLNIYFDKVKEFNKEIAAYFVSEGTLDFEFASGMTDDMSLRTGRIKK